MYIAHGLFWILLIWGLKDEEIGWGEAVLYALVWGGLFGLAWFRLINPYVPIVGTVVLDIVLLVRNDMIGLGK